MLQNHPDFSGLEGLCHFLQYIPQPSEILDFFSPVAKQIIQLLKGKPCLPAKDSSKSAVHAFSPVMSKSSEYVSVLHMFKSFENREYI